jgi:hypothetical protein
MGRICADHRLSHPTRAVPPGGYLPAAGRLTLVTEGGPVAAAACSPTVRRLRHALTAQVAVADQVWEF